MCQGILIATAGYVPVSGGSVELGHGPLLQRQILYSPTSRTWALAAEIKLTICVPVVGTAPTGAARILRCPCPSARPIKCSTQLILPSDHATKGEVASTGCLICWGPPADVHVRSFSVSVDQYRQIYSLYICTSL